MSEARAAVLGRVRAAVGERATTKTEGYARVERRYQTGAGMGREACLELFTERLREYDARVFRVEEAGVGEAVERVMQERGVRRMVVPAGLPRRWQRGAEFAEDAGFSARELDGFDGVMTGATVAVAETGSIVLQGAAGEGRRALTLVPDYHLCVVREVEVVETLVEGLRRLEGREGWPTTIFSGPSATADIEMTRIKGVHGPRFVDVLLVRGSGADRVEGRLAFGGDRDDR